MECHLPINIAADRPAARPQFQTLELYDLDNDISESRNVAEQHPQVVARLMALAAKGREELGDVGLLLGKGQRPAGWLGTTSRRGNCRVCLPLRWFPSDAMPLIAAGGGLSAWRRETSKGWGPASSVALDAEDSKRLAASTIDGDAALHNTAEDPAGRKADNLVSAAEFGDMEAHIEFLLPSRANSGVYFMGRYEIQLIDSYGVADGDLTYGHCGGIYQRPGTRTGRRKATKAAAREPTPRGRLASGRAWTWCLRAAV